MVVAAKADFTELPYNDGTRDVHSSTANLSENIIAVPFEDETLNLKAGIHLHWALPDALTRGTHSADGTDFPAAPNRWLVIRSGGPGGESPALATAWVVESDYLYPDGTLAGQGSVSVPVAPDSAHGRHQPFRYQGRKVPLALWAPGDPNAEYLDHLTAVGYGEPTFAAFYPNCLSVFGFHDDDYRPSSQGDFVTTAQGLQYDVIGWYSDPTQDPFARFVQDGDSATLPQAVLDSFGWQVNLSGADFPLGMLCYARLTFRHSGTAIENPALADPDTTITIANTGTEALAAYLAVRIDSNEKAIIEDQLEAIQLASRLANQQLDIGAKFQELRHEKGFVAGAGGTLWRVQPVKSGAGAPANAGDAVPEQVTLPDDLAHTLNTLNTRQRAYDQSLQQILALRQQLFADWYKYMLCAYPPEDARDNYPDVDQVLRFVQAQDLDPLTAQLGGTGALSLQSDADGNVTGAADTTRTGGSLADQVAQSITALLSGLAVFNGTGAAKAAKVTYVLRPGAAPRYWLPREPVVLLAGPSVQASDRYGADGTLVCDVLPDTNRVADLLPGHFDTLMSRITQIGERYLFSVGLEFAGELDTQQLSDRLRQEFQSHQQSLTAQARVLGSQAGRNWTIMDSNSRYGIRVENQALNVYGESSGITTWQQQPWNPFLLEWLVEVLPLDEGSNLDPATDTYAPDFITNAYTLEVNQPDLIPGNSDAGLQKRSCIYSGSSILTSQARLVIGEQLAEYLEAAGLDSGSDVYQHLQTAQQLLADPQFHCLSQALGGFNEALLMRRQTLQLPIADPLGFDDYRAFSETVATAVMGSNTSAPQPLWDFNPIRNGALRLLQLRLVDSFGQVKALDCSQVQTTEALKTLPDPSLVALPPRLVQPAQLDFRWLAANSDDQEMNDHPATTPICGWLLPNNLDNSLMVYDNQGKVQGVIKATGQETDWRGPADQPPVARNDIANAHLRRLVGYLLDQSPDFLDHFLTALDSSLANIDPENFAQHADLALLIGRPIALVRAMLNLELQGLPAVHQAWNNFRQDLVRTSRDTDGFLGVQFPIRVGEFQQRNDGLVGYWREQLDGTYAGDIFYSPESNRAAGEPRDEQIQTHDDNPAPLMQTLNGTPIILSMLVDPRGGVQATSGILPAKVIGIPPDQYVPALQAIEIAFLTAPILTGVDTLDLPLPVEAGYTWSWLPDGGNTFGPVNLQAGFATKQMIREGWLKLTPAPDNPGGG
jgi:hypothetical protein